MLPLSYGLRNLYLRPWRTLSTAACVALVVTVFAYLLSFADGLRRALRLGADPANLIVLAEGATAEANSAISRAEVDPLGATPGIASAPDGQQLISPEILVQANIPRRGDTSGAYVSVAIRGVFLDVARGVHHEVRLIEGRWFEPGADELIAGVNAARQFEGAQLGGTVACGERTFTVVGVFSAAGGAQESELWGHLPNIGAAYRRDRYSSARVRLKSSAAEVTRAAIQRITSSSVALKALSEPDYYATQTGAAKVIEGLAAGLALMMGLGAALAALNTMHASVAGRTREFAMLRAVGFSRASILLSVLVEAIGLTLLGGLAGVAACWLTIAAGPATKDLVGGATFASVAFEMRQSPVALSLSLALALLIGLFGGLWPARRASSTPLTQALREV